MLGTDKWMSNCSKVMKNIFLLKKRLFLQRCFVEISGREKKGRISMLITHTHTHHDYDYFTSISFSCNNNCKLSSPYDHHARFKYKFIEGLHID
jgi:hypothetical protein